MVSGNFVELDIEDSSEDSSEELSDDECNVCNSKEKYIDDENFSEKNKEQSGWASSITSDYEGGFKRLVEDTKDEDVKEDTEPDTPLNQLFYHTLNGKIVYGGIEDLKYIEFLNSIAEKNIYTCAPNKLYEIMEMNRESSFDINKLKMNSTFKFLRDRSCEEELIKYYS
tara:strand:+ start:112 stop:618 length:507 start_codon:yes stop_codon:yes gene_type:complete